MTSNLGTDKLNKLIGFTKDETQQDNLALNNEIKNFFRQEFINRLDKTIVFNQLTKNDLNKITKIELNNLVKDLASQSIDLNYDNKIVNFLSKHDYNPEQGARLIKHNIEELIKNPLSEKILKNPNNKTFSIKVNKDNLEIKD